MRVHKNKGDSIMKILVTGGSGFIGSHLVDRYINLGHEVIVIDDLSTGSREHINTKAKYIITSLSNPQLNQIIRDIKPDIINHNAAQCNVRFSVDHPSIDIEKNIVNTIRLLNAAGNAQVSKIIFASTGGAVYGDTSQIAITETTQCLPRSPYGINKLAAENYIRMYAQVYGYEWLILRYSNVYGPRQNPRGESGIISIMIDRIRRGKKPVLFGNGEQVRDFIHIEDVIDANMLLHKFDLITNDILNVGTQRGTSINNLVNIMSGILHQTIIPEYVPAKKGDLLWNVLCNEKLTKLGWVPKISLEEGIEELLI